MLICHMPRFVGKSENNTVMLATLLNSKIVIKKQGENHRPPKNCFFFSMCG